MRTWVDGPGSLGLEVGDASSIGWSSPGYGLVGMTERATLLGGTLEAAPSPDKGWTVNAVLPRAGSIT